MSCRWSRRRCEARAKATVEIQSKESWDKFQSSLPHKMYHSPTFQIFLYREICNNGGNLKLQPFAQQVTSFNALSLASTKNASLQQSFKTVILLGLRCKPVVISSSSFNVISVSGGIRIDFWHQWYQVLPPSNTPRTWILPPVTFQLHKVF